MKKYFVEVNYQTKAGTPKTHSEEVEAMDSFLALDIVEKKVRKLSNFDKIKSTSSKLCSGPY